VISVFPTVVFAVTPSILSISLAVACNLDRLAHLLHQASRPVAAAASKAEDWTEYVQIPLFFARICGIIFMAPNRYMHNGKPYFHNSKTNQTVWEKPFELLPLEERAALWKEYTASHVPPALLPPFSLHHRLPRRAASTIITRALK
jgi:hypothetical protein